MAELNKAVAELARHWTEDNCGMCTNIYRDAGRKLLEAMAKDRRVGCIVVEEASCEPHVHPSYGYGFFFTEDSILENTEAQP